MGSYSAPSFALGYYKAVQDVTSIVGSVQLGPIKTVGLNYCVVASALWDGDVALEGQLQDDTWCLIDHTFFQGRTVGGALSSDYIYAQTIDFKFPFVLRFTTYSQPLNGVAVCYFITLPPPGNPLF